MKVLIVKGWHGFGDRLESLQMCIHYAREKKRALYVDWTDSIWSHGKESFYTYFQLVNVPVLKSLNDIPENATVFPSAWKGQLSTPLSLDFMAKNVLDTEIHDYKDYTEDVVVFSSIGYRRLYKDYSFVGECLRVIDPRIIMKVRSRQLQYQLADKLGIHLRGTDRASSSDYKLHRIRQLSVRLVTMGALNGRKMIAVSDDPEYIKFWNTRFSDTPVLTERGHLGGKQGAHLQTDIPISKDELNVDMLVDFWTLASCQSILSTSPDSRFTHEAVRLHPFVNQILSKNGCSV